MAQRVEVVCRHSSLAMANALEHQNLFLMPVWRAMGKGRWIVGARTLPKTLTITAAVLALLAALCFWPWDFNVQCKGTLEPVERRDVFAGIDGVVDRVPVHAGDTVKTHDLLVRLRNTDAEQALIQVEGQLVEVEEGIHSRQRMLDDRQLRSEDRIRIFGELAESREKLVNLKAQRNLDLKRIDELSVRSPIDGVVVTWDLKDRLSGRPVQRGQTLLRVADPKGPWQLELKLPDNDVGFLTSAQHELTKELNVTYILATDPSTKFQGKVCEVAEERRSPRRRGQHRAGESGHQQERPVRSAPRGQRLGQGLLRPAAGGLRHVSQPDRLHSITYPLPSVATFRSQELEVRS